MLQQVDPFLQLVDDSKLQAKLVDPKMNTYGSKEDDENALNSLSVIKISEDQSTESFASKIVKNLEKLSNVQFFHRLICSTPFLSYIMVLHSTFEFYTQTESTNIKEQLLKDFLPDDVCPLGAQLVTETPGQIYQLDMNKNEHSEKVLNIQRLQFTFILLDTIVIYLYCKSAGRVSNVYNRWWLSNGFIGKSDRSLLPADNRKSLSPECRSIYGFGMLAFPLVYYFVVSL